MSLPDFVEVRERIDNIQNIEMQMFFKAIYLLGAARVSEMTGSKTPGDSGKPIILGPKGTDVYLSETDQPNPSLSQVIQLLNQIRREETNVERVIEDLSRKISIAVFKIRLTRQKFTLDQPIPHRLVALPMPKKYEPWTKELYDYFKNKGDQYVFPFYRQQYWAYIKNNQIFKGLTYKIDYNKTGGKRVIHQRKLTAAGLRQVRIHELINKYSFDKFDLAAYAGLSVRKQDVPVPTDKLKLRENWSRYIKKLCT